MKNPIKTYRFKLLPTPQQEHTFVCWLGTCRFLYNLCLEQRINVYRTHSKTVSRGELKRDVSDCAKDHDWIAEVHSQRRQEVVERLDISYKRFFNNGAGFPKFANRSTYKSFVLKQGVRFVETEQKNRGIVRLPKIGKVKFRKSQDLLGTLKRTSVIKEADGWYISFSCEIPAETFVHFPKQTQSVGIDVGLESLVSFSDGRKIAPPKALPKHEAKLKRLQRSVSRKKRGSNNRKKTVRNLAKEHLRTKRIRADFLHKLSTVVVRKNQAIAVEQLQIPNMMKNHNLAKSIADASWGEFIRQLEYKSAWHGRDFQKVSARNTSKTCSSCGAVVEKMSLSVRRWQCETCQTWHDRDTKAAINIKERATGNMKPRCDKNTEQIAVGQTVIAWETYIEH